MFTTRALTTITSARLLRAMSSSSKPSLPANTIGAKNVALAVALAGFVGTVYYTAISKMKGTDDLGDIIAQEKQGKK